MPFCNRICLHWPAAILVVLSAFDCSAQANAQGLQLVPTMETFAGTGASSYSGDGGFAVNAALNAPQGIAFDGKGNAYISDSYNSVIRLVNAQGVISTAYGNLGAQCAVPTSTPNACGDGGAAASAVFTSPTALLFDGSGNLYIADSGAARVRRIDALTGTISTVAGTGNSAYNGDGMAATAASLVAPHGLALNAAGDLYIADSDGQRVRAVNAMTGLISTVAGTGNQGYNADGIAAATAQLDNPVGILFDANGNLLIAEEGSQRIRSVSASTGLISTIAGNGTAGFSGDGGVATSAEINSATDIHLDGAGNLYIADAGNARVREVFAASGRIATVAGSGALCSPVTSACGDGTPATSATLNAPAYLGLDGAGNLYILDVVASRVRVTSANTVFGATTIGSGTTHTLSLQVKGAPTSITSFAVAASQGGTHEYTLGAAGGGCVVDGTTLNAIGTICSLPVTFKPAYPGSRPLPLIAATSGGTLHFGLHGIGLGPQVMLVPGTLATVAGIGAAGFNGDGGAASSAALNTPARAMVDAAGNVYIADAGNHRVREVLTTGNIVTIAGNGAACPTPTAACGDGGAATAASLNTPGDVSTDAAGNVYIADSGDNRVRRVDADTNIISTIAGNGMAAYAGDGGVATNASISSPEETIVDASGNLYIVSAGDNTVRFVAQATQLISTVAGSGSICPSATGACGDGSPATAAQLHAPAGIALDTANNLYIADTGDNRIRKVAEATGRISTVAGNGGAGFSGDNGSAISAELNAPHGVAVDAAGDLYIADRNNAAVRYVSSALGTVGTIGGNGQACVAPAGQCYDGKLSNTAALVLAQSATLDSAGNLYIADAGENRVRMVSILAPTFNFATTTIGLTSSDSPKAETVFNIGNTTLLQPPPGSGTNPTISSSFDFDSAGSCLELSPASPTAPLPSGGYCDFAVDFKPQAAGNFSGAVVGTTNNLNVPGAVQIVLLNGAATQASTSATIASSLNPSSYGESINLASHVVVTGSGPSPTGTVTFYSVISHAPIDLQATPASTTTSQTLALGAGTYTLAIAGSEGTYTAWNPDLFPSTNDQWTDSFGIELCAACDGTVHAVTGGAIYSTAALAAAAYRSAASLSNYDPVSGATVLAGNPFTFTLASPASVSLFIPAGPFANGVFTNGSAFANATGGLSLNLTNLVPIGTATVNSSAVATLAISTLPIGSDAMLAVYSGDANYVGSSSATITQVVNKAVGPDALSTTNAAPNYGEAITLTDTLPVRNSVSPTGQVSFYNATTLIGTSSVHTTAGVATAMLPISTLPVGPDAITAIYTGDGSYAQTTAGPLTVTVSKSLSITLLTTSNVVPVYQTAVTLADAIQIVDSIAPTGAVTFYNGASAIGSGSVNAAGLAALSTSTLPAGTNLMTAYYSGDAHYAASTSNTLIVTVGKLTTTSTLSTTNTTPDYGQAVTLTVAVPAISGVAVSGTVAFYNGSIAIGTSAVANNQATLTTASLPAGSDPITAVYGGNANYNPATASAVVEVVAKLSGGAPPYADTLTTSNTSPTPAQAVTFTDMLPPVHAIARTGMVEFYSGATAIGSAAVSSGAATLTVGSLAAGMDVVTAVYAGDADYTPSTSNAVMETVAKFSTTDALSASNTTSTPAQPVTLTDTLSTVSSLVPGGSVTFYSGSMPIGSAAVVNSVAVAALASLPVGNDSLTAVYAGDGNYNSSISNAIVVTVSKLTDSATLTTSNATPTPTQPVSLKSAMPLRDGIATTGSVTFYNGGAMLGSVPISAAGVAVLSLTSLPAGNDHITAVYSGDANYSVSPSNAITENVAKLTAANQLATSNASPSYGQSVTLSSIVSLAEGFATSGTVVFMNGSAVLGKATISAGGLATLTTGPLSAGAEQITASYSGDSNYSDAVSNVVTETVSKLSTAVTLTASTALAPYGQPVSLTAALTSAGGFAPAGTITFFDGTTVLNTIDLTKQSTGIVSTFLPAGTHAIRAVYSGDDAYNEATSAPVSIMIEPLPIDFSIAATPAAQVVDPGVTAAYTLTLSGLNGAFTAPVTLSAAGLPKGMTATFSPGTLIPGAGPATTTMTLTPSALVAALTTPGHRSLLACALLAIPLIGIRRFRQKLPRGLFIVIAAALTSVALTGCAGGYIGNAPKLYAITVTGTSGTLVHSTTITLSVR